MSKILRILKLSIVFIWFLIKNTRKLIGAVMIGFASGLGNIDKPPQVYDDPTEQRNDSDK